MANLEFEQYVKLPYAIIIETDRENDEIYYMAFHPELPGCMAQGDTVEEAIASLNEARADYIKALLEWELEVPLPKASAEKPLADRTEIVTF
jgi:antitoxin HicB